MPPAQFLSLARRQTPTDALAQFYARDHSPRVRRVGRTRRADQGSADIQNLDAGGRPLWRIVADKVQSEWNTQGNCMMVASGTNPAELAQIRAIADDMTLLVPGIGAQGGDLEAVLSAGLNSAGRGLIINSSRGIIFAADPAAAAADLRRAINAQRS